MAARERRAELVLILGRAQDAVADLQAIVADHPERERARGLLMQALCQTGRHTDALATFRSWRGYLSADLGLDPTPALERIEQDILRHALPVTESVPRLARRALPLPVTSFVGRDDDSAAAAAGSHSPFYPEVLASAAWGAVYRGDLHAAEAGARAALDAARDLAPITTRRALQALGDLAIYAGDPDLAADRYMQAYDLSVQAGDWLDAAWDAAWDAGSGGVALGYANRQAEASRLASQARDAALRSGAPSAMALVLTIMGEITGATDPGHARQHLQRALELTGPANSRLIAGFAEVSLATLHARHGEPATALGYYHQVISKWRQAGTWTPLWVTLRTLIDLLARVGAGHDAAILYGAVASASSDAPPYGADADILRETAALLGDQLTEAEFRACTGKGEDLNGAQVIDLALAAITRAAADPGAG